MIHYNYERIQILIKLQTYEMYCIASYLQKKNLEINY